MFSLTNQADSPAHTAPQTQAVHSATRCIRYFNVLGPNHETIEFCQVLYITMYGADERRTYDITTSPVSTLHVTKAGAFVEMKKAHIGNGTKVPHLSYVGDADLGEHTMMLNYLS